MTPVKQYEFDAAYKRVLQVTGAASQTALATALGVSQSSVWDVVRRAEGIPAGWLVTLVEKYGVSTIWVKTGQGPQRLSRSLGEKISMEEQLAELGRILDVLYKCCAGPQPEGRKAHERS